MMTARRAFLAGVMLGLLVTGCRDASRTAGPPPPPPVKVAPVVEDDVPISAEWVGTLVGYITAQIRARVAGHLISQNYTEGAVVKAGDLMFQVDPRPYQAALDQAEANLLQAQSQLEQALAKVAQDEAQVKKAEADQRRTELDVGRYTPLAQRGSVSQQELDNAVQNNLANLASLAAARASVQNSQASVSTQEANIAAARAALANAKLNLDYTRVLAPITGVAGFRVANIGDYVGPNDPNSLTTVSQVDPIYAQVPLSEQRAMALFRQREADPRALQDMKLELILADGTVYPRPGRPVALDRQVDLTTGTVLARGVFPNPGNVLRPGQYAKVRAVLEVKKNALLVPQRAVQDVQGVHQVAVVRPDDTVEVRNVKTDARVGSLWVVTEGLKPGERVVVEGADRLRPGQKVRLEASAPSPAAASK